MRRPAPGSRGDVRAYRVRAAAKVNLALRVGPARADGFHDLATLFVPIDLADEVTVRIGTRAGPVTCRVPGRPELDGATNLAARAAERFRSRFGRDERIDITIEKRIPVTAGLGGGSSDAAAVLRVLARAFGVDEREALAEIALEIGSDVPFFLGRGPAWGLGRGEKLRAATVPRLQLVLLHPRDPALAIRAGDAYRWLDELRHEKGEVVRPPRVPAGGRWIPPRSANDLQEPCFQHHPRLRSLVAHLEVHGASTAIMSGSGPTVFGIFADRAAARSAAVQARGIGFDVDVHVVRTLHRHPGVSPWKSPRSGCSPSRRRSSRPTSRSRSTGASSSATSR